jgi:DNA ligase-1
VKAFAELYAEIDARTGTNVKLAAIVRYLHAAEPADAAWAVYFLAGGKPRQLVPTRLLREQARLAAGLPEWLFDESYQAVGDLAETIALLLPPPTAPDTEHGLAFWVEEYLLPLRGLPPEELTPRLLDIWARLDTHGRLVCGKLLTGSFRVGVSRLTVTRALAAVAGVEAKRVAERMVGYTAIDARPTAADYHALIAPDSQDAFNPRASGQPYPFFLAHPLALPEESDPGEQLGTTDSWLAEWKWDGIRAQLVKRDSKMWLWSRGEELITERFPELAAMGEALPDGTVIDGEIVIWRDDRVQPFALLQQRIGRKNLTAKLLQELPAALLAYDLLEWRYADLRQQPQRERRTQLESLVRAIAQPTLHLSPLVMGESWAELAALRSESRERGVEGLMLKERESRYGVGRTRSDGIWWKWKIEPYSVDAVLIYAQRGHGRRASLYTDFTFAVWDKSPDAPDRRLVPFAKAYSGLSDAEFRQLDTIIRKTTVEKFGPVRSVTPTQLFELGFEGIAPSTRHKSGVAVRFPRMLRWRRDKPISEADTLETLRALLPPELRIR